MFYQNSYPFHYNNFNIHNSPNKTIPFKSNNTNNETLNNTDEKNKSINILGISLEIDDLIIIGLMILLFLESDKNYALIIILGLILLNVNLSDIFNIF